MYYVIIAHVQSCATSFWHCGWKKTLFNFCVYSKRRQYSFFAHSFGGVLNISFQRFCYQEGTRFIYDVQSRNVEHFCWQAYDSVDPVYSKLLVKEVVPVFGPFAKFLACGRNQWIRFRKSGCIGCCSMRRLWNVAFAIIYRRQQYFGKVYTFTWLWCKPPWPRAFWSFGRRIC